jgi:vacuolar ATPase assembly integral membrane protein VMA21
MPQLTRTGNATYAGAFAAIMANVVLISYIVVAMREEDETKSTEKKGQ